MGTLTVKVSQRKIQGRKGQRRVKKTERIPGEDKVNEIEWGV